MKTYACTNCSQLWNEDELVTIENAAWTMKPIEDECCPSCLDLCVEVQEDQ